MDGYMKLIKFLRPYLLRFFAAMGCIIMVSATNLAIPMLIKDVIDRVLIEKDTMMLNLIAGGILLMFVLRGMFFYGQNYLITYVGQKVIIDIRQKLFGHLMLMSANFYSRRKSGTVMSNILNDVGALQTAIVNNLVELLTEGVVLIGSIGMVLYLHWKLSLLTFVTLPLIVRAVKSFGKRIKGASSVLQERYADISAFLYETVGAVRTVQSFGMERYETERFWQENLRNFSAQMKTTKLIAFLTPVIELLATVGITAIIWYGGHEVLEGNLSSGALIAFLMYVVNLSNPVKRLSRSYASMQQAMAAAERVFEIIEEVPEIRDNEASAAITSLAGQISFEKVSFSYDNENTVLQDISFTVKPGEVVALVGQSGSGKSTLINLIPRFYDIQQGSIKIDGHDIRSIPLHLLRQAIGTVPQDTVLFNDTVANNIRYGRQDADLEQVMEAARAANAHQFIMDLPQQYDTITGERGTRLSGGQRQRIAIARGILRDPEILLLDEATSALDTESESLVQEALNRLMKNRAVIVIAHRLSTIMAADVILVMENGRIIERGTHEELLALNGRYSNLYNLQFKKEESSG